MSSTYVHRGVPLDVSKCIDGKITHGNGVTWQQNSICSTTKEQFPFLVLEYDHQVSVDEVIIHARPDCCTRMKKLQVVITDKYPEIGKNAEGEINILFNKQVLISIFQEMY